MKKITLNIEEYSTISKMADFKDTFQPLNILLTMRWHWKIQKTDSDQMGFKRDLHCLSSPMKQTFLMVV
jgi:hypothetical protein